MMHSRYKSIFRFLDMILLLIFIHKLENKTYAYINNQIYKNIYHNTFESQ